MNFSEYRRIVNSNHWPDRFTMTVKGWQPGIKYHEIMEKRYYTMIKIIDKFLSKQTGTPVKIFDIGCFPGAFSIILKKLYQSKIMIYGVGMALSDDFKEEMLKSGIYEDLFTVDLDPEHHLSADNDYPSSIPSCAGSADIIIASEIFEHFYSPLNFIQQCSNLLKVNGKLLITTPNINYFGNICRLLAGKSIYTKLEDSHLFFKSEWRPHMRVYSAEELNYLMGLYNFRCIKHFFINNCEDKKQLLNYKQKVKLFFIKLFYVIPIYRNQYIGIFEKK